MKRFMILSICIVLMVTGCTSYEFEPKSETSDETLLEYIQKSPENYTGENYYYHTIESIEVLSDAPYRYEQQGEVRSNGVDRRTAQNKFKIKGYVDDRFWVESYEPSALNGSEFKQVVLLSKPVEVGNQWTFKTTDIWGEKQKVTGEIMAIDAEKNQVEVQYTTDSGVVEKRTLQKSYGTVKFIKELKVDETVGLTGYALKLEGRSEISKYDALASLAIEPEISALLRSFNEIWSQTDSKEVMKYLVADSPAQKKASAKVIEDTKWCFEGLKVFEQNKTETEYIVSVMEKYSQNDVVQYNTIAYRLIKDDDQWLIYDFEPVKANGE